MHLSALYIDILGITRIVLHYMQSGDYLQTLADRVKRERLSRNIPQREMARRIDLSPRAYQNFESSGRISLDGLVKIFFVLGRQNELLSLLTETNDYRSLEEFEQRHRRVRQRARSTKGGTP
jgi:transcriptional regulator with XRE-family HTH domain